MVSNRTCGSRFKSATPDFTRLYAGLAIFAFATLTGSVAGSTSARAQAPVCAQNISWSDPPAGLPDDVCGTPSNTDAANFFTVSWQLFKFLVWPASNERGKPDIARKITDQKGPRTFETFKGDWETFLPNAEKPVDWDQYPSVAAPCKNRPALQRGDLVLASFTKFGNLDEAGLSNLLIAQNSSYVRYLAAYNETVFRKISDEKLYDSTVVGGVASAPLGTPIPDLTKQDDGALTIKSAWIELPGKGPNRINPSRFYVRSDAWIQEPDKQSCRKADVGLVGLHIVYKTRLRPQWIWATFEQVDNVPQPNAQSGQRFTFNDGDSSHHMTNAPEPDYQIPLPSGSNGPGNPPRPYQVERLQKIRDDVMLDNQAQQSALRNLDSVWQYYGLVMTQWPTVPGVPLQVQDSVPEPPCSMRNANAVTNTTMETFLQTQQACDFQLTCMGCHAVARKTDFVFSILANHQKPAAATSVPGARAEAIKRLQDILQKAVAK